MAGHQNTLKWIATIASMHYFGGACNPAHMRAIANIAADALDGRQLPGHDTEIRAARARSAQIADRYSRILGEHDAD